MYTDRQQNLPAVLAESLKFNLVTSTFPNLRIAS